MNDLVLDYHPLPQSAVTFIKVTPGSGFTAQDI